MRRLRAQCRTMIGIAQHRITLRRAPLVARITSAHRITGRQVWASRVAQRLRAGNDVAPRRAASGAGTSPTGRVAFRMNRRTTGRVAQRWRTGRDVATRWAVRRAGTPSANRIARRMDRGIATRIAHRRGAQRAAGTVARAGIITLPDAGRVARAVRTSRRARVDAPSIGADTYDIGMPRRTGASGTGKRYASATEDCALLRATIVDTPGVEAAFLQMATATGLGRQAGVGCCDGVIIHRLDDGAIGRDSPVALRLKAWRSSI